MHRPYAALVLAAAVTSMADGTETQGPLGVAKSLLDALIRCDSQAATLHVTGKESPRFTEQLMEGFRVASKLERALDQRFGARVVDRSQHERLGRREMLDLQSAREAIDGASARILSREGRTLLTLTRVGTTWRVVVPEGIRGWLLPDVPIEELEADARAGHAAADEVIDRLRIADAYAGPGEAYFDFTRRWLARRVASNSSR